MGNQEYFDSEINPGTRVVTSTGGDTGPSKTNGNGGDEGHCFKFSQLKAHLELFAYRKTLVMSGGGVHTDGGKCSIDREPPEYSDVPFKCNAGGKERDLFPGEQMKTLKYKVVRGGKTLIEKTEKKCEPCDDSTDQSKRDALAGLMDSLSDDALNALKVFMDAICSPRFGQPGIEGPDGPKHEGARLSFDLNALCYKERIAFGCTSDSIGAKACTLESNTVYGEGYGDTGSGGFSNDILSLLTKLGSKMDLAMLCDKWGKFRDCLFQAGGDGDPKAGIGEKLAACMAEHLTVDNFNLIAIDNNFLPPWSFEDRMEILKILLDQILKCMGCASK